MNSANKFDMFKQSLASMGRNSQVNSNSNANNSQVGGGMGIQKNINDLQDSNAPNFAQIPSTSNMSPSTNMKNTNMNMNYNNGNTVTYPK
jgi:ethanolamine ammonia-lyase small subunit